MDKLIDKLALGTAQFGFDYGISNINGQISFPNALAISNRYCECVNESIFDTALGYGESHKILGKIFDNLKIESPKIVTKFRDNDFDRENQLNNAVNLSLNDMGIKKLYGFLAHSADSLIGFPTRIKSLLSLKASTVIEKIGVSVYHPSQIRFFLDNNIKIDIVQVPFSIFDQRFGEIITECRRQDIEVYVRSVYMQGLIFKDCTFFDGYFSSFKHPLELLKLIANDHKVPLSALALQFALTNDNINKVVVGFSALSDLEEIVKAKNVTRLLKNLEDVSKYVKQIEEEKLLPYNWPQHG